MCSATAAVGTLVGGALAGASKPDIPKQQTTSSVTKDQDANYWNWWNQRESQEEVSGNYKLNRKALQNRVKASKGTSQLQIDIGGNKTTSTGKQAQQKRSKLGIS